MAGRDKFGNPYWYASDIENEFLWELSDDPNEDRFFRPDEKVSQNGDGSFSFASTEGLRPSLVRDTTWEKIGCDVNQSELASKGYGNDRNLDFRDIEFKYWCKIDGGTNDKYMTPELVTGRHSTEPCNEGSSMGFNFDYNNNPFRLRPFKEQYHSEYAFLAWLTRTDILNAKVSGLGRYIGVGLTRFNKTNDQGQISVMLEGWVNPDPAANIDNWLRWMTVEDKGGWGTRGKTAGALNVDQILHWAMPVAFRVKLQDSNLTFKFKNMSLRRINPFITTQPDNPVPSTQFGFKELQIRRHINTERASACTVGGGGTTNLYTQTSQNGDTDLKGTDYRAGEKAKTTLSKIYNVIIQGGKVYLRKTGTVSNNTFIRIRKASDSYASIVRTLATIAPASIGTSETEISFTDAGNTWRMQLGDIICVEHDGSSSNYVSVFRSDSSSYDGSNSVRVKAQPTTFVEDTGDMKAIFDGVI